MRILFPLVFLACPGALAAEPLFNRAGADRGAILSGQFSVVERRGGVRLLPGGAKPGAEHALAAAELPAVPVRPRGKHVRLYLDEAIRQAKAFGVPVTLFLALIQQESAWNRDARSHAGAIGLTQLMPGTARYLRVDPLDPVQNLKGGAKFLRLQFDAFGSWRLALAAYNAGPGAVKKYGGVPPYRETQDYIRRILGR